MRFSIALMLFLCCTVAVEADGFTSVPDAALFRTDERYEITLHRVCGSKVDVRDELHAAVRRILQVSTSDGGNMTAVVLLHAGVNGKILVDVQLQEFPRNGGGRASSFSKELTPGESWILGQGWNGLYEMKLMQK